MRSHARQSVLFVFAFVLLFCCIVSTGSRAEVGYIEAGEQSVPVKVVFDGSVNSSQNVHFEALLDTTLCGLGLLFSDSVMKVLRYEYVSETRRVNVWKAEVIKQKP